MNVSTMRKLDKLLGVPACLLLTGGRRLLSPLSSPHSPQVSKILFIKLAEQGSTVLAYPALKRAAELVGRENVYFLVFQENRFILDALEVIPAENVIAIPTGGIFSTLAGAFKSLLRCSNLKIDAAIDMEFFARSSAVLAMLSGARWRAGLHMFDGGPYRGDLMTHRVSLNPYIHTSQMFLTLVEALTQPPQKLPCFPRQPEATDGMVPQFRFQNDEMVAAQQLISQASGRKFCFPLILLNCNASDLLPLRRWPSERYVELARRLLEKYPQAGVAFTGAPAEAVAAAELVKQVSSDRCFSLAGRTSLRQLLAVYDASQVLVTNDSGPAHFATMTSVDVVTIFGPETPQLFGARSPRNHVLWAGLVCSPCVNAFNNRYSGCRDNACMQAVTVEQVFAEVCKAMDNRRACGSESH